ncbi:HD domain-containing phosphohydrolase [Pelotalea chapellei]|nr:HD domain-containing phosphohydrolase [Pelotalea chapellei]
MVAIIVIAMVSITFIYTFQHKKKLIEDVALQTSGILVESIVRSINNSMKYGHTSGINGILSGVKNQEYIKAIRIIDDSGVVLHSANSAEVGMTISSAELQSLAKQKEDRITLSAGSDFFHSFSKIPNTSECNGCHSASSPNIATLETELSLVHLNAHIKDDQRSSIVSAAVLILLIIGVTLALLIMYVDNPIRMLIQSMQQIEQGNFDLAVHIDSTNEMSLLSKQFNMMTCKLKDLMSTTVIHERELARAQEKLAHHHETHLMNQRLEEQLKEIENLNISLEERIEEVEQANYTIADLASELEQKNINLGNAVSRLSTLYKVGLAINSTMNIDRLFNLIVRTTSTTLKAHIGYIILYDAHNNCMNVTNLIGNGKLLYAKTMIPMQDSSVSSWVIRNHQPLLIADISQSPQFARFSDLGYERKTLICVPLMVKDEVIGTLNVVNKLDDSHFNADELEMLTTIAAQAAIAIKNATLYEEQQQTYLNTIQALVSAIEASDSYTKGHSERVTRYSLEIGRRLNLPPDRMQILERAAILHDIGKIGIDLTLLHKEGKLTPEDIRELQQHPVIGMKILEPIDFLQDVRICIGQHHERYDGFGYPNKAKKEDLLLESRILAVADSFDAMTSDRPYRKALVLDNALRELYDNSGSQFDPAIVSAFSEIIEEGMFSRVHGAVPIYAAAAPL